MKQEPLHLRYSSKKISSFAKPIVYFLCLLLAYLLGYLSSSTHNNNKPPDHVNTVVAHVNAVNVINHVTELGDHSNFGAVCGEPVPPQHIRHKILERVFKGTSPWENFPPSHVDNLLRKKWIKGWGSNGAVFENLIRRVRPKTIIEVGTFLGASALHMVELTRRLGLDGTQIVCIDDFRGWPGFSDQLRMKDMKMVNGDVLLLYQFMQNVMQANATECVVYMPFSSGSALEKLCEWGVFGELIEVDAGHDFHSAWSDINRAFKLLKPGLNGGVIFGHDYFTAADNRGVRRAVNLFARVHNLTIQVDGQHWVFHIKNHERLNDIVGSAYYVAPEVLHRSYSLEADIWSIGVITYILLCGSRPFWARTESGIFRAVLRADPNFEDLPWPSVSPEAKDFVKRLLNKDYRKRMTAAQALTHPWLRSESHPIPLDILVYKLVKSYLQATPLKRAALKALSKALTEDELVYLRAQFMLLEPSKDGRVSIENFRMALLGNATDAMRESRVPDILNAMTALSYKKLDFEEFCAAAISTYQLEALEEWEQIAAVAFQHFEQEGNRHVSVEELARELNVGPTVHSILRDWIRSDGKLTLLGYTKFLHGVTLRTAHMRHH